MPLVNGTAVRQIVPAPIEGKVIAGQYNNDLGKFRYLVEFEREVQDEHEDASPGDLVTVTEQRWFTEEEIEEDA